MIVQNASDTIERLLDREAIRDCLMRYCHGVDRCDEEMIRGVYWPEATDEHGMFDGSADEYVTMLMPMLRAMEATSHMLGNIWIVLRGRSADVETYMTAYHRARSSAGVLRDSIISGRYLDRVEKRGEEWRILKRAVVVDWFRQYPDSADWEKTRILKAMKPSGRKPDDRYYDFFDVEGEDRTSKPS
jgi:SnoaL-like domain